MYVDHPFFLDDKVFNLDLDDSRCRQQRIRSRHTQPHSCHGEGDGHLYTFNAADLHVACLQGLSSDIADGHPVQPTQ